MHWNNIRNSPVGVVLATVALVAALSACSGGPDASTGTAAAPGPAGEEQEGGSHDDGAAGEATGEQTGEQGDARAAFEAYRDALAAGDGAGAAALVTSSSLSHMGTLQALALHGGPGEIGARPVADRLMIGALRVLTPPAVLEAGAPAELLAGAVEAGLVGADVAAATVRRVTVDGSGDGAVVSVSNGAAPVEVRLVREAEGWRVDLVAALEQAGAALVELARGLGVAEDELVLSLLAASAGRPVGPEVFASPGS